MAAYTDRLTSDYRKTFATPSGRHVLMDMYHHGHGDSTTWPKSGNPFEMTWNEGKRAFLLRITGFLKSDAADLRKMFEAHLEERVREESL